jgi:hypothetical protein
MTVGNTSLGDKRVCPSCAARFYDLEKRPIECPKCQTTFEPDVLFRPRTRTRQDPEVAKTRAPKEPAAAPDDPDDEEEDEEEDVAKEVDLEADVVEVDEAFAKPDADDDDDDGSDDADDDDAAAKRKKKKRKAKAVSDDETIGIEDTVEDLDDDDDDALLPGADDDDDDNMADVLGTEIKPDQDA